MDRSPRAKRPRVGSLGESALHGGGVGLDDLAEADPEGFGSVDPALSQAEVGHIDDVEDEAKDVPTETWPPISLPPMAGFAWASKKQCAGPSTEALSRARRLLKDVAGPGIAHVPSPSSEREPVEHESPGLASASDARSALHVAPEPALERAPRDASLPPGAPQAEIDETASTVVARPFEGFATAANKPAQAQPTGFASPLVRKSLCPHPGEGTTCATPPAAPPRKGFVQPLAASSSPQSVGPRGKRMNLGMTPSRSANVRGRALAPRFSTPFKEGKRPDAVPGRYRSIEPSSRAATGPPKPVHPSVFDLCAPHPRHAMHHLGMLPQSHTVEDLLDLAVPAEVIFMSLTTSATFAFKREHRSFGSSQARLDLLADGCHDSAASQAWVDGHWALILWKLAAFVRWSPDRHLHMWSFENAVDQLRYRYEREHRLKHRSPVLRLREQECLPSTPLCLVVASVLLSKVDGDASESDSILDRGRVKGLELSDGWHCIRCSLDLNLGRAVTSGKIKVGAKLAISGAKWAEPVKGSTEPRLELGSNRVARAHWAEPLGCRPRPYIATLRSLHPRGGVVPLVDVVVVKVFPCGFVESGAPSEDGPWDTVEEERRQDSWASARASKHAELVQEKDDEIGRATQIASALAAQAKRAVSDGRPVDPAYDPDEVFGALCERGVDWRETIKRLSFQEIRDLAAVADVQLSDLEANRVDSVDQAVQEAVPPRRVRQFRVVRIRDWQAFRKPTARTGQVTVWDVGSLGDDFLCEGARYWISNLLPQQPGSWRGPDDDSEVILSTRRDTRWTRVRAE